MIFLGGGGGMNEQFILIETDVQSVQNTTKEYNTNTEIAYTIDITKWKLQHC